MYRPPAPLGAVCGKTVNYSTVYRPEKRPSNCVGWSASGSQPCAYHSMRGVRHALIAFFRPAGVGDDWRASTDVAAPLLDRMPMKRQSGHQRQTQQRPPMLMSDGHESFDKQGHTCCVGQLARRVPAVSANLSA
uniref:Uncharacterized protein n=1 Tax=Plectus sambesii TaxID=2011161 RepID=A0A914V8Y4_9BILA